MEACVAVLADHREDRLGNAACLVWPEGPLPQGRQFMTEECIRVSQCLINRTGNRVLQHGPILGTTGPEEERLDGRGAVTGPVKLERSRNLRRAGHGEQRRLEEREGVDVVRHIQRDLKGDAGTCGVANHMRSLDAEVSHQRAEDRCFPREGERARQWTTACVPHPMVAKQPKAVDEGRLLQERTEPIRPGTMMHEDDSLPSTADLIVQFDVIEHGSIHGALFFV